MSRSTAFNRRAFIKGAGMTALAGATGVSSAAAAAAETTKLKGKYSFDEVYDRFGTECIKWDYQVSKFGDGKVKVGPYVEHHSLDDAPAVVEAVKNHEVELRPVLMPKTQD